MTVAHGEAMTEALVAFGVPAWTDETSMVVLSDRLLELGMRPAHAYVRLPEAQTRDAALYQLECETRRRILEYLGAQMIPPARLELHVTGRLPDVAFIVFKLEGVTLTNRVEVVPGVLEQPRLLRA